MSTVEVSCGECGHKHAVEEALLGTTVKCPKCKFDFVAETGDAYGLADDFSAGIDDSLTEFDDAPSSVGPALTGSGGSTPKAAKSGAKPETEAERKLRERLERWAEE